MATNDSKISLSEIGRQHFESCAALSARSTTLNAPLKEAASRLSAESLKRASAGKHEALELLSASVEAHINGKAYGFYADYVFNCSIFVASMEQGIDELLISMAGEAAASSLEMMMLSSLDSGHFEFISGSGGDMLDNIGDTLGITFYKVSVRVFRVAAMLKSRDSTMSKMNQLSTELDLEKLRVEARELLPIARKQCQNNQERIGMLEQFESIL